MHLLEINRENLGQADPFILKSGGRYYIYVTGHDGIYAYESDSLFKGWTYYGLVMTVPGLSAFWAPSVIELDGKFYMYNSIEIDTDAPDKAGHKGAMHVSVADNPLGPFTNTTQLLHPFSIDSHVVKNEAGLFIFYSTNRYEGERVGTYIVVDKLLDPFHTEGKPSTVVLPTLDEEIFQRDRFKKGEHWHTIEGAFYFKEGDWQYVMYSGNCFEQPSYYIGYARAKTDETDLRKIKFEKYPDENTYAPVIAANDFEEGTGHHSLIKEDGQWYAVYHARDYNDGLGADAFDSRNARICKLNVKDGIISAERYKDHI
ncbi:MAG: glycoside hydrolase family 43 protein [Spirochaetales bacterium]|nr:glycoside hydrolase family 43 protein [Spirochaetia bacterium]MDD7013550.1 glycoside hydrolase family 43 protein [Spirochaetales bacterium]